MIKAVRKSSDDPRSVPILFSYHNVMSSTDTPKDDNFAVTTLIWYSSSKFFSVDAFLIR